MKLIAVTAACGLLAACTSPVVSGCVPVRAWSAAEETKLASELAALPDDSEIWALHDDWSAMRAASRACQSAIKQE